MESIIRIETDDILCIRLGMAPDTEIDRRNNLLIQPSTLKADLRIKWPSDAFTERTASTGQAPFSQSEIAA